MTLTEDIKKNPYLKVRNCTDVADVEYAISECKKLKNKYGERKTINRILGRLLLKKKRLLNTGFIAPSKTF